jgi:hypothetical protein
MKMRLTQIISFIFLLAGSYIAKGQTISQQAVVPTSTSATISFYITGAAPGGNMLYRIAETQAGLAGATITVAGGATSTDTYNGKAITFEVNPLSSNTLYYWDVYFYGSGGTSSRLGGTFTTLPATSVPAITGVSANPLSNGFTVNYTASNGNLSTVINYGTSETALTSSFTGTSGNGKIQGPTTKTGLLPTTRYYYQVVATNANGNTSSAIFNTTTLTSNSVAEFNFDNTRQSINGTSVFTNGGTFVTDRNGIANNAISFSNGGAISATINGLPSGKTPKTVSIWVKFNSLTKEYNYIFGSGQRASSQAYDLFVYYRSNTSAYSIVNFGINEDVTIPVSIAAISTQAWRHYVTTYDGTNAKVYLDGTLLATQAVPNWFPTGTNFFLGGYDNNIYGNLGTYANMDDLKIFNKAMSAQEVLNLREFNSPEFTVAPTISAVAANAISSNSAVIAYNVKYGNITSTVKYGTAANALTSSIIGVSGSNANYANLNGSIGIPNLLPSTRYYYVVEATNENGTTTSTVGDFTTAASDLVAEFKFDNTRQSVGSAFTFATGTTTFTTDRFNIANGAIKLTNSKVAATVTGLPFGNAPRTVSTWVRFDSYINTGSNGFNAPWGYGNPGDGYGLGIFVDRYNTSNHTYMSYSDGGSSTQSPVVINNSPLAWQHMLTTYDGTDAKIYLNGALIYTQTLPSWDTQNLNNNFVIGGRASNSYGPFDGALDDLQIYNRALTAQEVSNVFLTNSATAEVAPILSAIQLSNVSLTAVTVNYKASIGNITSVVKYGTSANSLTNVLTGVAGASSSTTILDGAVELTGLTINTKYYYQVVATNEFGTKSSEILSFETTPSALLANFTFDQTLNSTNGSYTLSNIGNGAYIPSRSGPGNALEMKGSKLSVNIPTLPLGIADRTISAWFKMDSYSGTTYPLVFSYGDAAQYKTFGFYLNNVNRTFQGFSYDYSATTAAAVANQWYHVVVTLEAGTAKVYFNNQLVVTQAVPLLNTTKNVNLDFNIGPFTGGIDDVQIYDRALTLAEVSNLNTYNTSDLTAKPGVNNVFPSQVLTTTAKINYNVISPAFTSNVKYGTDANSLSNPTTGTASSGFNIAGTANLTSLTANTTYYYQVEVTNVNGTTSSAVYSFKTATPNALNVVAKFDFDNNKISTNRSLTFGAGANTFVTGRDLSPNGALQFANNPVSVAIPTLPIAKAARTVSVWAKIDTYVNNYNFIFGYGLNAVSRNYGFAVQKDASVNYTFHNYAFGDDVTQAAGAFANPTGWHHYVTSFDGTSARIYVDGALRITLAKPNWNTASSDFFLGGNSYGGTNFTGAVDDLIIFDRALTDQEISNLFTVNNVLPVTLISYTAKAQNNNALLNWKTASEINNSHFVIERSVDGQTFNQIAIVNAKSAQGADYTYTDYNTTSGTNYYRLLQVDLDGKTTDLGIKSVKFNLQEVAINAYPNPATDYINLSFEPGVFNTAILIDVNGKVMNTIKIASIQNIAKIDLSNVNAGTYLVQLKGANAKTVKKVIKR